MLPIFYAAIIYLMYYVGYVKMAFWLCIFLIANIFYTIFRIVFFNYWYQNMLIRERMDRLRDGMDIDWFKPRDSGVITIIVQGIMASILAYVAWKFANEIGYVS